MEREKDIRINKREFGSLRTAPATTAAEATTVSGCIQRIMLYGPLNTTTAATAPARAAAFGAATHIQREN
jgi:hypothetical protein